MNAYSASLALQLPPERQAWFVGQSDRMRKEPLLGFLLTLFLGLLGAQYFYLGDYTRAIAMLLLTLSGIGVLISLPWTIVSLLTIWGECESLNDATDYWLLSWAFAGTVMPPSPRPRRVIGGLPAVVPAT
jgi:TM2 domain-containing membrane protein YozV